MRPPLSQPLLAVAPEIERALTSEAIEAPASFAQETLRRDTVWVAMRDGVRLATDVYLPPQLPAPTVVRRTPYGRATPKVQATSIAIALRGYVVVNQDCRGTGDSEPGSWDYYVYESEDSVDFIEWVTQQPWCDGFIGSLGASYVAQTQWCMSAHPRMSTVVPEVSGLGIATNTARLHMFLNAYAQSVGKGSDKLSMPWDEAERRILPQTLSSGFFNEPLHSPLPRTLLDLHPELRALSFADSQRRAWEIYSGSPSMERARLIQHALGTKSVTISDVEALPALFGQSIAHDAHALPHANPAALCESLNAPALMITGWYDWALNDALATWTLLKRTARDPVRQLSRLIITPSAHNVPGYQEGTADHPELRHNHRTAAHIDLLLKWYCAMRERSVSAWPDVTYYLMGANEWHVSSQWPPPGIQFRDLHLAPEHELTWKAPHASVAPVRYIYDPNDPTPTLGGSILSYVYPPGSVDVSALHRRSDVITFRSPPLEQDLDVVGPLRMILYASSSAIDTDFCVRLSDVFPDGRAIQLQNGILRARFRKADREPALLEAGQIYRLEIDMWATANRFRAGHRLCIDICSADFPRYDRNSNRGGRPGDPIPAEQTIFLNKQYPSRLLLPVLSSAARARRTRELDIAEAR